jgi:hypothetical protein
MAIFTNDEIKKLSKDILDQPSVVANWQNAYDSSLIKEQEILKLDEQNKKFFDGILSGIQSYHTELAAITGQSRTLYNEADLIASSENIDQNKPHFPNPPTHTTYWTKVQPKILASNNGNPVTISDTLQTENTVGQAVTFYTQTLVNGFNLGSNSSRDSSEIYANRYEGSFVNGFVAGYNAGDKIILTNGTQTCLVEVTSTVVGNTSVTGPPSIAAKPDIIYWKVIFGVRPDLITGTITFKNNSPAYTLQERIGLTVPLLDTFSLELVKTQIDLAVDDLISKLQSNKTILQNSVVGAPYKGQNETEIAKIDQTISDLNLWKSYPSTVTNINNDCRFDDLKLPFLDAVIQMRSLEDRPSVILAALGNVSQNADGSYTGSGLYFTLFLWIDKRINVAEGSLSEYKGFPASQLYYTQQIALAQNILDQYNLAYLVIQLSANFEAGGNILKLTSVVGLNVNDSVKIMDNGSSVFDRIIIFVNTATNEIYLDNSITENLNAIGKQARIYKEL